MSVGLYIVNILDEQGEYRIRVHSQKIPFVTEDGAMDVRTEWKYEVVWQ